ncbi:MAG TPA: oxidoreductase [Clostridiales bacterium]|nr:oxidoreductase [Clostridiales bacterium]
MGVKIGVVGCGSFSRSFINLFKAHPDVEKIVLCDLDPEKVKQRGAETGIENFSGSLDHLLETDVDAVALFTQNWLHGPQAKQALLNGKHVYSAVPMGITLDEIKDIVEAVEKTGNIYMMGETSYYYPDVIYCRNKYQEGAFGDVVYTECEYYHDWDHGLYDVMKRRGGDNWKWTAGGPPMHYPTHSVSCFVSMTGAYLTKVSCQGFSDRNKDGYDLYGEGKNEWDNSFSNESALFSASDGSAVRVNEFRRIGYPGTVRMSVFGTEGSFENKSTESSKKGCSWMTKQQSERIVLDDLLECKPHAINNTDGENAVVDEKPVNFAKIQPVDSLPDSFKKMNSGHFMSHNFLIHEFIQACYHRTMPCNNAWMAARYTIPGIIAHESAKRNGELLMIPDFGNPKY